MARQPRKTSSTGLLSGLRKAAGRLASGLRKAAGRVAAAVRKSPKLKPLKELSPEYQKRLRRQAKELGVSVKKLRRTPGLTQKARGHKPAEHLTRKSKLDARVEAFAEKQAKRGEAPGGQFTGEYSRDPDEIAEAVRGIIATNGVRRFTALEKRLKSLHNQYVNNGHQVLGINMDTMETEWGLPRVELFYH